MSNSFKFKNLFTSYLKSADSTLFKNSMTINLNRKYRLNFEKVSKILAFHCAHVSYRHKCTVKFDSDAVEFILDTGCYTSISFTLNGFIDYKPMKCKVEVLGIHDIVGTGTLKYTLLDGNDDKVTILIENAIHVHTIYVRLISLQQIDQQSDDKSAGGDIRAEAYHLR